MRLCLILMTVLAMAPAAARARPVPLTSAIVAPVDPLAYRALTLDARAEFDAGNYVKAERLFRQAAGLYSLDSNNWRYLAASLRLQDKWAEAIPAYQQLIDRAGSFVGSGRYWQAVGQVKLGRTEAALATLRTMIEVDHEAHRPALVSDKQFESLRNDPRFIALVAPQPAAAPSNRISGWRSDLDYLVTEVHRLAPDYRGRPLPAPTEAMVDRLREDIPRLSDEQIYVAMSNILGSLHQSHTMMWGFSFEPGARQRIAFSFLPVQPYAFGDGLYVVAAEPAYQSLIGTRITAIGGMAVGRVMSRMREATSFGSEAEFAWTGPLRAMSVPLLVGIGAAERGKPVMGMFEHNGRSTGVSLQPTAAMLGQKLPRRGAKGGAGVQEAPFELSPAADSSTVIVRFDQVQDSDEETLSAFGARVGAALVNEKVRSVIVDLRINNGGNSFLYPDLIRALAAFSTRPGRQVYALIGRNVYSAAGNFATDLERFANPIFIGEPTGNMGNQFGDEGAVVLPWSGLHATVASVKWQLSDPWDTRGSIVPQIPVEMSAADYFAGRDPAMEIAQRLSLIKR